MSVYVLIHQKYTIIEGKGASKSYQTQPPPPPGKKKKNEACSKDSDCEKNNCAQNAGDKNPAHKSCVY